VAILDDYQNVALTFADRSAVAEKAEEDLGQHRIVHSDDNGAWSHEMSLRRRQRHD
jgi:predicted TIM-barrel fold metal-dependent hydrolase